jgi:hydroxymethylglutaryl-CoA synthase
MLQADGIKVPSALSTFQVQHACAGGTLGLLAVAGLVSLSRDSDETGLVLATDISRYALGSTAEITQGAGAAAMLVEKEPRLLSFDPASAGMSSRDVDDFFRPLGSVTAKVKGGYSMECYHQSFDEALGDHAERAGLGRAELLRGIDAVVLHTPFRNMPEVAIKRILGKDLGLDEAGAQAWLTERSFFESVDIIADIGNSYSASLFIFLMNTLRVLRERHGQAIVGKRILLASYGSGNVMVVLTLRIEEGALAVIDSWDIQKTMLDARRASMEDYDLWTSGYQPSALESVAPGTGRTFRLLDIRADGYRIYGT